MEIVYVIENFSIKGGAERIIAEKANYLASRFNIMLLLFPYIMMSVL